MMAMPSQHISVLWVAESNFAHQTCIKLHSHDYYHLFMVRQGPAEFTVGDNTFTLGANECVLARPGQPHSLEKVAPAFVRCYEVKFTVSDSQTEALLGAMPSHFPADPFAYSLTEVLIKESTLQEPSTPAFTANYLTSLICYLFRRYGDSAPPESVFIDTTGYSKLSREIVQYLERNYHREVPLQEVADTVGFNKNYICSAFKRDTGMTIGNCHTIIRIRKAAELISFSDMTLNQVAESTGFTNLSHFNRIFKKVVHLPPGQYRRMFASNLLSYSDRTASDQGIQDVLAQNGFIVAVLGRKQLSIEDIIVQMKTDVEA